MSGYGRPTKFCKEICDKFLEAIPKVLTLRQSAALAGVTHPTITNWLKLGEEEMEVNTEGEYAQFFSNVKRVQADQVVKTLCMVRAQTERWQASAWILERCFREDFAQDSALINEFIDRVKNIEHNQRRLKENHTEGV